MFITEKKFLQLVHRVEKLEKQQQKEEDKLDWALNQFRYKKMTADEREALAIIEKELGKKASTLRAKPV